MRSRKLTLENLAKRELFAADLTGEPPIYDGQILVAEARIDGVRHVWADNTPPGVTVADGWTTTREDGDQDEGEILWSDNEFTLVAVNNTIAREIGGEVLVRQEQAVRFSPWGQTTGIASVGLIDQDDAEPDPLPPTISEIADQSVTVGEWSNSLVFTLTDPDTPLSDLIVSPSTSDSAVVSEIVVDGEGGERSVRFRAAAEGMATITLTVSDGELSDSTSFLVTATNPVVPQPPTITPIADQTVTLGESITVAFSVADPDTSLLELVVDATSSNGSSDTLTMSGGPADYSLNVLTGNTGTSEITVSVSDGTFNVDETFTVTTVESIELPGEYIETPFDTIYNFAYQPSIIVQTDSLLSDLNAQPTDRIIVLANATLTVDGTDQVEAIGVAGRLEFADNSDLTIGHLIGYADSVIQIGTPQQRAENVAINFAGDFLEGDHDQHGLGLVALGDLHIYGETTDTWTRENEQVTTNLDRTITINGGHVFLGSGERGDYRIEYAAFNNGGRTTTAPIGPDNQVGRYAIHFHHAYGRDEPIAATQFDLIGNVFSGDGSAKWGVTIHDSSFGAISQNIVGNFQGAGIVTEQGNETGNTFTDNYIFGIPGDPDVFSGIGTDGDAELTSVGSAGVGLWLRNSGGHAEISGNVVGDSIYGVGIFSRNQDSHDNTAQWIPTRPGASTIDGNDRVLTPPLSIPATPIESSVSLNNKIGFGLWDIVPRQIDVNDAVIIGGGDREQYGFLVNNSRVHPNNLTAENLKDVFFTHNQTYANAIQTRGVDIRNVDSVFGALSNVGTMDVAEPFILQDGFVDADVIAVVPRSTSRPRIRGFRITSIDASPETVIMVWDRTDVSVTGEPEVIVSPDGVDGDRWRLYFEDLNPGEFAVHPDFGFPAELVQPAV